MKDYSELKQRVLSHIVHAELATYESVYAPSRGVITISNLMMFEPTATKYGMRKVLKELIADGLIEYTSEGCPAIESIGEYHELICDAAPPINGYALTKKGFECETWLKASQQWEDNLRRMCEV